MFVSIAVFFDQLGQWPSQSSRPECQDGAGLKHAIIAGGVTRPRGNKSMKGSQRIALTRRRAYIRVVCGRNICPSAATTGSKVRRACCQKYVRGWTALMASVNA